MLQYLHLKEREKVKARVEKQSASPESSQFGAIEMQKKKHRFTNLNLKMQKESREGLLKILKGHRDLQKPASKMGRDDLNNFRSNSEPSKSSFKSFENASEGEVESKDSSEDLNENQLEAEWA